MAAYAMSEDGTVHGPRGPLKGTVTKKGYIRVKLSVGLKKPTDFFVHDLMLRTYVGPRPPGMQTRHLNNTPGDNNRTNLAYGTPVENAADKAPSRLTECRRGHPFDDANTLIVNRKDGRTERWCRQCKRDRQRAA